jgi:hypothetical protein
VTGVMRDRRVRVAGVIAACVLVWVWRRGHQFTHPYVWDEESVILRTYLDHGWAAALKPVQGYVVLPASFLVTLAATLSFAHLAGLEWVFAVLVAAATFALLVVPDSRWGPPRVRAGMAAATVLVPVNPEVFGVLLYSFWWATLWPLIVLGWRRSLWWVRAPALLIGAFATPAGGALCVLFGIEYARRRRPRDAISAAILLTGFVVQVVLVETSRANSLSATPRAVAEQMLRTGGFYWSAWLHSADRGFLAFAGLLFLGFLVWLAARAWTVAGREEPALLTLGALAYMVLSAIPAPLVSDPVAAGPRYFFLPFVAFGWVLIQALRVPRLRTAAGIVLCAALLGLSATFSRAPATTTEHISWPAVIAQCGESRARTVAIPIYFDGSPANLWTLTMTPAQCRRLG